MAAQAAASSGSAAARDHRRAHRPVEQAGIQHRQPHGRAEALRDLPLAGTRRPIDGDDETHYLGASLSPHVRPALLVSLASLATLRFPLEYPSPRLRGEVR